MQRPRIRNISYSIFSAGWAPIHTAFIFCFVWPTSFRFFGVVDIYFDKFNAVGLAIISIGSGCPMRLLSFSLFWKCIVSWIEFRTEWDSELESYLHLFFDENAKSPIEIHPAEMFVENTPKSIERDQPCSQFESNILTYDMTVSNCVDRHLFIIDGHRHRALLAFQIVYLRSFPNEIKFDFCPFLLPVEFRVS